MAGRSGIGPITERRLGPLLPFAGEAGLHHRVRCPSRSDQGVGVQREGDRVFAGADNINCFVVSLSPSRPINLGLTKTVAPSNSLARQLAQTYLS
jgi:hypothetical protein